MLEGDHSVWGQPRESASGQRAGAGQRALSIRLKAFIQDFTLNAVGSHRRKGHLGSGSSLWQECVEDQRGRHSRQGGHCREDTTVVQEMCCEP